MSCRAVCAGAMLKCEHSFKPSELIVLPGNRVNIGGRAVANITDHKPELNIPSFLLCHSPENPEFIAATAAAFGVPVPVPCIPITVAPWMPKKTNVIIGKSPILTSTAKLKCLWGEIFIVEPGQLKVVVKAAAG